MAGRRWIPSCAGWRHGSASRIQSRNVSGFTQSLATERIVASGREWNNATAYGLLSTWTIKIQSRASKIRGQLPLGWGCVSPPCRPQRVIRPT